MLTFILMTLFVVMSPGVDTALITKRTLANGRKDGLQMALGIATGSLGHTVAATLGLSALILQSPTVQNYMEKLTGIVLIGFGIKLLFTESEF